MTRQPVVSSRVNSIGHENNVMEVEFNTGAVWQYSPVSAERHAEIMRQSVGVAIKHGYEFKLGNTTGDDKCWERFCESFPRWESKTGGSGNGVGLADPNEFNWGQQQQFESSHRAWPRNEFDGCSSTGVGQIANSHDNGRSQQCGEISGESKETEIAQHGEGRHEVQREWRRPEPEFIGINVGDTESDNRRLLLQSGQSRQTSDESFRSGQNVADGISQGLQGHAGHEHRARRTGSRTGGPVTESSVLSTESTGVGLLANAYSGRSRENWQPGELWPDGTEQSSCDRWRANQRQGPEGPQGDKWPARPGEEQYDWEEPRVLTREAEREVGIAIDGYNLREDLLRLAGNAVVAQQAEYAFRDLIRKHAQHNGRN